MFDPLNLQVFANHTRAAAENMAYTLQRTAHSAFVKETEDFTVMLVNRKGETFGVPMGMGATWYPGLTYGRAIAMIDDYKPGDVAFTNDPYSCFVATHAPGHPSVETGLLRWRDHRLDRRSYPQHRHGRRGAGLPVASVDGNPSGGHPLPADETGQ
jgi:hypothetical protein